ncbi:MAG: NAD-dependent epimerase/dehydratase family protein [Pirellulales bacterium]|nr:NAD-dependent epimerase/dehydratase family protein [Pirellulales bacterium]
MAKVLVTGASGFIGSHLVAALTARGDEVACLVRKSSRLAPLRRYNPQFIHGDVTDRESLSAAVAGKQIVYHLAGCTQALNPRQFYRVNRWGVANVAQACAGRTTPPVLVSVSSLAAAGPSPDGQPKTEADRPVPVSHYGHSKRAGERVAEAFADRVPITIVRPPIVLGEYDRMGFPLFHYIARFGVHLAPGLSRPRFSLIHADDLAELLILAAERGRRLPAGGGNNPRGPEGYYFAACEVSPLYSDLGRMVSKALGRRWVMVIPTTAPVVWTVAMAGELVSRVRHNPLFMNVDKAREITAGSWLCSARAAAEQLNFAVAVPLFDRLRQTAEWYRREKWL